MAPPEAVKVRSAPEGSILAASGLSDFSSGPLVLVVVVALVVPRTTPIGGLPLPTQTLESIDDIASHLTQKHFLVNCGIPKNRLIVEDHLHYTARWRLAHYI